MKALEEIRARLKALGGELEAILAKDTLTADDMSAIETKGVEIEQCETQIKALEKAEETRARVSKAAASIIPTAQGNVETNHNGAPADIKKDIPVEEKLGLICGATLKAQLTHQPALKVLSENGYASFAKDLETEMRRKAVDTNLAQILIPETISSQIIELLRPETTFFQGGPRRVQFTNGQFKAPRGASGASASYVGEGQKKPVTNPEFDSIDMKAKKLAAIVLITQEAKNWTIGNIDAYIRSDLTAAMSQAIDLNAYWGTGTGDSPTGILKTQGVPTFQADFADPANPTLPELDAAASRLILSLTEANIGASPTWAWLMSYRTLEFLKNVRVGDESSGQYAFPSLHLERPVWKGFRVLVSNQVPNNLGSGTDETTISLIDFRHVLYGEEGGLIVKTSTEATVDVSGTLVHLWQQNMYGILTEHFHDFGLRHLEAAAVLEGVRIGSYDGAGLVGSP